MRQSVKTPAFVVGINRALLRTGAVMLAGAFATFCAIEYFLLETGAPDYRRFLAYLGLAAVILVATRVHIYLVDRRLRRQLGDPISVLAESLRDLGKGRDFTRRLPAADATEISELYEGFNEVLGHLQQRESWLVEESERLKEQLSAAQQELREERRRLKSEVYKRRRAQAEMLKLSSALTHSADAVMVTSRDGRIEYVNPAFEAITGFGREEVIGKTPEILRSDQQDPGVFADMWRAIENGEVFRCELINRRKDGSDFHEEKTVTPLKDAHGRITHFIATGVDISERIRAQEKLEYMAHHDAVTGLPNRVLLLDRVAQALARAQRENRVVAVMFIDLDGFKAINDTVGHHFGDRFLGEVAARLQTTVRDEDTVARLGGDEFAIVLEGMNSMSDIGKVARKLTRDLALPFLVDGREMYVTGSIGVARHPVDGSDVHTLLRKADSAMYRAKQLGKNTYRFYSEVEGEEDTARLELEQQLRRAVERHEFIVYYQPQVSIDTSEVVGVEALLRWQHPEQGIIEPNRFIPLLEETGLIVDVGEWVLREVCIHAVGWDALGLPPVRVAVNLSSKQFTKRDLVGDVARILDETGLDPKRINIEITEGTLASKIDSTVKTLDKLNALGITISVDDFGVGYSSLNYLKRFPIHKLKIDQSFVRDVTTDANDAAIASAIIALAHKLNLEVIAEGVETLEQLFFLSRQGCHEVQGHLISHPLAHDDFVQWIGENRRVRVKRAANM